MIHKRTTKRRESTAVLPTAEGLYFRSLDVSGVRCFGDDPQCLDLSDNEGRPAAWTLLLGENGTGKTTVLQLLAGLVSVPEKTSETSSVEVPFILLPQRSSIRLFTMSRAGSAAFAARIAKCRGLRCAEFETQEIAFRETSRQFTLLHDAEEKSRSQWAIRATSWSFRKTLICGYGASRRIGKASLSKTSDSGSSYLEGLFGDSSPLRNPEEWLLQKDYAALRAPGNRRREIELEKVRSLLVDILPDVEAIRISSSGTRGSPIALFRTPYGEVTLRDLSLGYRTLVAWMVDFASRLFDRYPDSPDPLAEPAVCLVDEIDLHLHPTWQRSLMTYLSDRFPNTQFIVTAHSPLVVQAAASVNANLALFKRVGDHVEIKNDVDEIKGWRVDQILTSELFDLPTARPADVEQDLARRKKLLSKAKLTAKDKRELEKLNKKVHGLPIGETADDVKRLSKIIADATDALHSRENRK